MRETGPPSRAEGVEWRPPSRARAKSLTKGARWGTRYRRVPPFADDAVDTSPARSEPSTK